jgi:transposase-like protein
VCFAEITCPSCASRHVVKNGTTRNRKQRYLCRACSRQFISNYTYQGCRAEVRQLVVPMTLNGSGIRDITRVLQVSINTVLKVIRAAAAKTPEPHLPERAVDVEVDEMWSFVGKKRNRVESSARRMRSSTVRHPCAVSAICTISASTNYTDSMISRFPWVVTSSTVSPGYSGVRELAFRP